MPERPISELTRGILTLAWQALFDQNDPSLFLPDLLRGKLEPLDWTGPAPAVAVPVPQSVGDVACMTDDPVEFNPIATAAPTLQLMHARIRGLYAILPVGDNLSFSATAPELTAKLRTGTYRGRTIPLGLETAGGNNYGFAVRCCVPAAEGSRQCSAKTWTATAQGKLTAKVKESTLSLTVRVDFPRGGDPVITVKKLAIEVEQSGIDVDFDVAQLDPDFVGLADLAVQEGLAGNAVQNGLQLYFDNPDFKATLGKVLTEQIAAAVDRVA